MRLGLRWLYGQQAPRLGAMPEQPTLKRQLRPLPREMEAREGGEAEATAAADLTAAQVAFYATILL